MTGRPDSNSCPGVAAGGGRPSIVKASKEVFVNSEGEHSLKCYYKNTTSGEVSLRD